MAMLTVENINVYYGVIHALKDISFQVNEGEIVALIGANGAGKTTVFNMLTGVYRPTDGGIRLNGENLIGKKPYEINRMGVARTFQNIRLFNTMTVEDNVKVGLHNQVVYGMWTGILRLPSFREKEHEMDRRAMKLLKIFDLDAEANYKASQLPYGKQRRLEIARALATNPKLLLLDEHTAALDPKTAAKVMELTDRIVREGQLTTLMITHNMRDAIQYGNRLIMLHDGHVILDIAGEEKKKLTVPDLLEQFTKASGDEFANDRAILS